MKPTLFTCGLLLLSGTVPGLWAQVAPLPRPNRLPVLIPEPWPSSRAHLMAQIHSGTPLAPIYTSQDLPVCHAKDGTVIVLLEWDYASWTQNAANFLEHLRTVNFRGAPVTGHRLVITGVASPRVREELARQDVVLVEKALPSPLR